MKLDRYPLDNKGDPLDLLTGVVTDQTGNSGTKTPLNQGPDGSPIDAVGLILVDKDGNPVAFGGIESFATRGALSGSPAISNKVVWLAEAGREGPFQFVTGDQSALVTADPRQGFYIAPSTSPTGTAGAWVRKSATPDFNVKWFGCAADDATDDSAAFTAAIALLKVLASNDDGTYKGSNRLRIPAGSYYLGATTLDITHTLILEGEGAGLDGGKASKLRWGLGATGLRVQVYNTSDAGVVDGPHYSGMGGAIKGLYLQGAFVTGVTAEAEAHGIHLKGRTLVEDVKISAFQGDGVYIRATAGGGAPGEGNANSFILNRVTTYNCRNGVYIDGADVNAGCTYMLDTRYNRQWGLWDSSFLGNTHYNPHAEGNGISTGADTPTLGATVVSQGGNRYGVKVGQAVGASTNAPTGTATDNTWWYYLGAGGAAAPNIPAWSNGMVIREGGSYYADNANAVNTFINPYSESGQNLGQYVNSSLAINGNTTWKGGGVWVRSKLGAFAMEKAEVQSDFVHSGVQAYFGPVDNSQDPLYQYYSNNSFTHNYYRSGGTYAGSLIAGNAFYIGLAHPAEVRFSIGATAFTLQQMAKIDGTGLVFDLTSAKGVWFGAGPRLTSGTGTPEGAITAAVGSLYMRNNGAAGTSLYIKETGAGNTGWTAVNPGGATIPDGDKGDITTSGSGATWTIDATAVTFAKMQDVAANSVVARAAGTSGVLSGVALGANQLMGRGATGNVAAQDIGCGLIFQSTTLRTAPTEQTAANGATITPTFTVDFVDITAQNTNFTLANWTGTAIDAHGVVVRMKDNGTARTWAYGTKYIAADGLTLPTTTVVGKTHELGFVYNATLDKFIMISAITY